MLFCNPLEVQDNIKHRLNIYKKYNGSYNDLNDGSLMIKELY